MTATTASKAGPFAQGFREHSELISLVEETCSEPLSRLGEICAESIERGGKLFLFGNGGSAADAQHLAAEFTIRFISDRRALPAIALTTDSSVITACGNDLGFDRLFARQIEGLGRSGDVAIGFSTSGNSGNVRLAMEMSRELGVTAAAFAGCDGGKLCGLADPLIVVPSRTTARVQEMHILLGHLLCADIERRLRLA